MRCLSIISLAICLLLFSCSKDQSSNKVTTKGTATINPELISEVERASNISVQKLSFRLLNSAEMEQLWQQQISYYLKANLKPEQKTHLLILLNYITKNPQIFDAGYDLSRFETFSKPWISTARSLFSETLLDNIISSIHTEQSCKNLVDAINGQSNKNLQTTATAGENVKSSPDISDPPPNCTCSTGSDYCGQTEECEAASKDVCTTTKLGCGTLLLYSCNGTCQGGA